MAGKEEEGFEVGGGVAAGRGRENDAVQLHLTKTVINNEMFLFYFLITFPILKNHLKILK